MSVRVCVSVSVCDLCKHGRDVYNISGHLLGVGLQCRGTLNVLNCISLHESETALLPLLDKYAYRPYRQEESKQQSPSGSPCPHLVPQINAILSQFL